MARWQERTELMLGAAGLKKLSEARVVIVGLGGVGAAATEMLVRAGIGHVVIVDSDTVNETNVNRQLIALHSTVGLPKADVLAARLQDINPDLDVTPVKVYLNEENISSVFDGLDPDYVVDAIDTLSPKIALIQYCLKNGLRLVSSMGSGAKFDITKIRIADISKTRECPLAHMLRKRLHKLGIYEGFKAVYSEEIPRRESMVLEESANKKSQTGTISYLPSVFGCACAQTVITDIAEP